MEATLLVLQICTESYNIVAAVTTNTLQTVHNGVQNRCFTSIHAEALKNTLDVVIIRVGIECQRMCILKKGKKTR